MERLIVSQDQRHLVTQSGKDFFWLADTVWAMPTRMKWDDAICLMDKRVQQGFTVLQIAALGPGTSNIIYNTIRQPAFFDNDLTRPNEIYFEYLDWLIEQAEQRGLYVLLLPVWGTWVIGQNWGGGKFDQIVNAHTAFDYGQWLGVRYGGCSNVIWCLGGDIHPLFNGIDYKAVWRRMAEGVGKGITGTNLRWNVLHKDWDRVLMTYHPCYEPHTGEYSTMSYWTDEDVWIDFIMNQSGHNASIQSYLGIRSDYNRENPKPIFDGEPAYEQMPAGWGPDCRLHDAWMVRKRAYWSLFAGSFGHTYGHACVWGAVSEKQSAGFSDTWYTALDRPGAWHMRVLSDFIKSRPFKDVRPCQEMLGHNRKCGKGCLDDHRQACVDKDGRFAFVYMSSGGTESVNLSVLNAPKLNCWWFEPKTGECVPKTGADNTIPEALENVHTWRTFSSPDCGDDKDWILVLEDSQLGWAAPGIPLAPIKEAFEEKQPVRDWVFLWDEP